MVPIRVKNIKRHKVWSYLLLRQLNTNDSKCVQIPNPKKISSDMVGPPDPVSNLRRVIFKQPTNETKMEKTYREMRTEVQEFNQKFWTHHNTRFFQVCLHNLV